MRFASIAVIAGAALLATGAAAVECAENEDLLFGQINDDNMLRCRLILEGFEVCSDECLTLLDAGARAAPNCTSVDEMTLQQVATARANNCKTARASSANKYTPQETFKALKCLSGEESKWDIEHSSDTPFGKCVFAARVDKQCSDECVKILEEGISKAPTCLSIGKYTVRELDKTYLVQCLKVRNEDFRTNKVVMASPAGGSTDKSTISGTASPSATTTTPSTTSTACTPGIATAATTAMVAVLGLLIA